jgi:uncharacterized protein YchJ
MAEALRNCSTCVYFAATSMFGGEGECRRFPPIRKIAERRNNWVYSDHTVFPMVRSTCWCGEWCDSEVEAARR